MNFIGSSTPPGYDLQDSNFQTGGPRTKGCLCNARYSGLSHFPRFGLQPTCSPGVHPWDVGMNFCKSSVLMKIFPSLDVIEVSNVGPRRKRDILSVYGKPR